MSESGSRVYYPFEIARRPSLEPEVRHAIIARWSSRPSMILDAQENQRAGDKV